MKLERIEYLLERLVLEAPPGPVSPECLGIGRILAILDSPERIEPAELDHLTNCPACQRAVHLACRERVLLESPLEDEGLGLATGAEPPTDTSGEPGRMIKLGSWLRPVPVAAGIAAALLIVVGVALWSRYSPPRPQPLALLGPINGEFKTDVTRSDERPEKHYLVNVESRSDAYLAFIYLYVDSDRKPQLRSDAETVAAKCLAGHRERRDLNITKDPAGRQWIAAVASSKEFNPSALRDQLQTAIVGLPADTPIDDLIARLEQRLRELGGFEFRGLAFDVPADNEP